IPLNKATLTQIEKLAAGSNSSIRSFEEGYQEIREAAQEYHVNTTAQNLTVPAYIDFQNGKFAHQGEAVLAYGWLYGAAGPIHRPVADLG
ncbi:MAG: hypothetical protein R6U20_01995, partial [Longimonas sp.]|uniref:hypothetical protein n=1 Tax=Longimonas sp. TaxID=2039626 RepID=UPI003975CEFB